MYFKHVLSETIYKQACMYSMNSLYLKSKIFNYCILDHRHNEHIMSPVLGAMDECIMNIPHLLADQYGNIQYSGFKDHTTVLIIGNNKNSFINSLWFRIQGFKNSVSVQCGRHLIFHIHVVIMWAGSLTSSITIINVTLHS